MKLYISYLVVFLLCISCSENKISTLSCKLNRRSAVIRNVNTTLSVDQNLQFEISYSRNGKAIYLMDHRSVSPSIVLIDSAGNRVIFSMKSAMEQDVDDIYGAGQRIIMRAESGDHRISCKVVLTAFQQFPDAILVQSSFKNISTTGYPHQGYLLNQVCIQPRGNESEWWTFQGASYHWGQDFVFALPDTFRQDNYMGMNGIREGGGIPVVDVWNKEYGMAFAYLGERPEDISLPVEADNGSIHLAVEGRNTRQVILPGDSLVTVQTAIILHQGDFYEPLKVYSHFVKPLLDDFQEPVDLGYHTEWCTWGYNQNFNREQIMSKVDTILQLGIRTVILDDGWSVNHGDWNPDPRKFPSGDDDFKKLISTLHEKGLKVWLWWVPGYVDSVSSVAALHPEWLIMNKDGSVHPSWGLCPAYAPVSDHYKTLVKKFAGEYQLDGFKLDFREINSAPPCYNPVHRHTDPFESYYSTPELFRNICEVAKEINPEIVIEYCSCGIPPNIYHLPYANLAVTSDPAISQVTNRIKMYKALMGDHFPVLEEYCGVLAGPLYQMTVGAGGVPGTFSTYLDEYHAKWLKIYDTYQLSREKYMNLYDIGFDYPEGHVIKKGERIYYAFYTHPWTHLESPWWFRFGKDFSHELEGEKEFAFPEESFSGRLELRGLDENNSYRITDYENKRVLGIIKGSDPFLDVSFINYLLLEAEQL